MRETNRASPNLRDLNIHAYNFSKMGTGYNLIEKKYRLENRKKLSKLIHVSETYFVLEIPWLNCYWTLMSFVQTDTF